MKWTPWLAGSLTAVCLAGCDSSRRNTNDTGSTAGAGADSAAWQGGASDTGMTARSDTAGMSGGMTSDTGRTGPRMHSDTSGTGGKRSSSTGKTNPNQTKSGVTDTKTGESTLGEGVTRTSPDQGQPVTAKGDTIRSGGDSASGSRQ